PAVPAPAHRSAVPGGTSRSEVGGAAAAAPGRPRRAPTVVAVGLPRGEAALVLGRFEGRRARLPPLACRRRVRRVSRPSGHVSPPPDASGCVQEDDGRVLPPAQGSPRSVAR